MAQLGCGACHGGVMATASAPARSAWPTGHELRRAEYMAAAVHSEVDHTLATLRAHKRPEPQGGGHDR